MHPFDEALALSCVSNGPWIGKPHANYTNMVGPFGGLTSALLLKAALDDERRVNDPVALTVNFCGGLSQNEFRIETRLQRGGKYTQHWSAELHQDDEVKATASIVFGKRGDVFSHQTVTPPTVPPPDACDAIPKGMPLRWIDSYSFRFADALPQFTGKAFDELQSSRSVLWVADDPPRPLDWLSLAALGDNFFLRLLHLRGSLPPMGTVSLTTYFHATADEIAAQGDYPLLGVADAKRFHANFADQHMELWSRDGTLLASGVQVAWYKA